MRKYKVIYMGTPLFAKEVLDELQTFTELEIVGVVCQPDKKVGRKQVIQYSEVKKYALEKQYSLFQPEKIMDAYDDLLSLKADVIITCAYGQFLPRKILELTPKGVINVHASLLPKYRGGAPMQHAIINNEHETGITLMKSVMKMDAGPIYDSIKVPIDLHDTLETLQIKLIEAAKTLLKYSLINILEGKIEEKQQDESQVSFAYTIQKNNELIDFKKPGNDVYNLIRALNPAPYAYGLINGKRCKFGMCSFEDAMHHEPLGKILSISANEMTIAVKNGLLFVFECQPESKQMMSMNQLVNGYKAQWEGKIINDENN